MKQKHRRTLEAIYARPTPANIQWRDIQALFMELVWRSILFGT